MNLPDIIIVFKWWLVLFVIGLIFLPLTTRIFSNFFDKGYIFSKILGITLISYAVFLLGILKIFPFTELTIVLIIIGFLTLNILVSNYFQKTTSEESKSLLRHLRGDRNGLLGGGLWKIFFFEEIIFVATLFFWSYIRAHEPSIHGLEKYMDFGFINSILRSEYFPPVDMWFPPLPINYYYFGHLVTAVLTKLSTIPSFITYNLMLSTLFAFTFTGGFSIGANLFFQAKNKLNAKRYTLYAIAGLLTAFLISFAGNLHAIYSFFKPYENENPVPFWQLIFSPNTFPNGYWYPNATRFIPNTIHEFPIYSSIVSDLHGHFLDVPFVLLTIAVLLSIISNFKFQISNFKLSIGNWKLKIGIYLIFISFLLAVMYMTNAWDGIIYFLLTVIVLTALYFYRRPSSNFQTQYQKSNIKNQKYKSKIKNISYLVFSIAIIGIGFFIFTLPFNLHFKPFASGIGVLCAPEFLTTMERLGPFLFEPDHCQKSPWWQLAILYGFFYFWAISFVFFLFKKINPKSKTLNPKQIQNHEIQNSKRFENLNFENLRLFRISNLGFRISSSDLFVLLLILFSTLLIILPEFIYVKDIYPGHYRANTMFKLVYQAFILLSISSSYIIIRLFLNLKSYIINHNWKLVVLVFIGSIGLLLVLVYPYLAINSYYGNLKTYHGLDGIKYLKNLYATDYQAILWINKNIKRQPVILEAQGDSYTDYARVSSNTGLPTVLGWTVHEWLWRGSYDIPSPRIEEVQKMYESEDLEETKNLLKKYKVSLVFLGDLERQKYPNLNEGKFKTLGKVIYQNGNTIIYKID